MLRLMDINGKSDTQLLVEERTGREIGELLRELYVDKRHSQKAIADALSAKMPAGRSIARTTVSQWLDELGITRDDRPAVSL
jgi:arginine repressor